MNSFLIKLKLTLLFISFAAFVLLLYNFSKEYQFNHNPLPKYMQEKINKKIKRLKYLTKVKFNIEPNFKVKVFDKLPSRLFGLTTISKEGYILILLNKKRFKENLNYMIEDVLPHEWAHAVMFAMKDFSKKNGGHTKKWQQICKKLEGKRCYRFVNNHDILIEKIKPF